MVLEDGTYILLSGRIVYAKVQHFIDYEKKEQLLNAAKMGNFTQLKRNPYVVDPLLKLPYSLIL